MRLDAYIRVSRVGGREGASFISPEVQRDQIARWADYRGVEIAMTHTDLDASGSTTKRPGFEAALDRIEAGLVEGLVVAKIDRFARSLVGALEAIQRIDAAGATFVSIAEGIDPSTPAGKMMQRLLLILAEYELDRIRESWREARRRAVARGVHIASRTPTGYERNDDGTLRPGVHAARIRELFEAAAAGASWGQLAQLLDGVPSPYGSEHWTSRALSHVLRNRVYLGEARSGEFHLIDAHSSIIDRATYQAAQRAPGTRSSSGGGTLLAGLLRCAGCRYSMKPGKTRDRRRELVRQYHCRGARSAGECQDRAAVLGSMIEPWVVERFFERVGTVQVEGAAADPGLRDAEQRRDAAAAELAAYRDEALVAVIGRKSYAAGLEVRAETLRVADVEVARLREQAGLATLPDVAELRQTWPDLTVAEQRQLLSSAIDAIFLRRSGQANVPIESRALILWRGEGPDGLPSVGHRIAAITPFEWTP